MKILFESIYLDKSANYFEILKQIDAVKLQDLQNFSDEYNNHLYMKGLITGNIIETDASRNLREIEDLINSTVLEKSSYYI